METFLRVNGVKYGVEPIDDGDIKCYFKSMTVFLFKNVCQ